MVADNETIERILPSGLTIHTASDGGLYVHLPYPITVIQEDELARYGLYISRRSLELVNDGVETDFVYTLSRQERTG